MKMKTDIITICAIAVISVCACLTESQSIAIGLCIIMITSLYFIDDSILYDKNTQNTREKQSRASSPHPPPTTETPHTQVRLQLNGGPL